MVITRGGDSNSSYGSGSGSGIEPIDERLRMFIAAKVTCGIVDATKAMFGTIKEGIMELLDERIRAF